MICVPEKNRKIPKNLKLDEGIIAKLDATAKRLSSSMGIRVVQATITDLALADYLSRTDAQIQADIVGYATRIADSLTANRLPAGESEGRRIGEEIVERSIADSARASRSKQKRGRAG